MLIVTDKITGEEISFPDSWDEVTYSQFMALADLKQQRPRDVLFILCNVPDKLAGMTEPNFEEDVFGRLVFLTDQRPLEEAPVPESVTIAGRTLVISQDIGLFTYGHKMAMDDLLADLVEKGAQITPLTAAKELLGVYLDDRHLDSMTRIYELMAEVEKMAITDVLPVATFFLANYRSLKSCGRLSFRQSKKKQPKKWLRWLCRKLGRSTSMPRFLR